MRLRVLTAFALALPFLLTAQQTPLSPQRGDTPPAFATSGSTTAQASKADPTRKPDAMIGSDFRFETVSIKKSGPDVPFVLQWPPDGVRFHNLPIRLFLLVAYQPKAGFARYTDQLLLNVPPWMEDHYDIDAKVAPEDIPRWRNEMVDGALHRMALQHIFQDRCKLQSHLVPVTIDGYALQVTNVDKLIPYKEGTTLPKNPIMLPYGGMSTGVVNQDRPEMKFYNTTMEVLANMLSRSKVLVVDETGLSGHYDFSIWRNAEPENPSIPPPDFGWDLRTAGLKVVPRKVVAQAVFIDHIERPDPN